MRVQHSRREALLWAEIAVMLRWGVVGADEVGVGGAERAARASKGKKGERWRSIVGSGVSGGEVRGCERRGMRWWVSGREVGCTCCPRLSLCSLGLGG